MTQTSAAKTLVITGKGATLLTQDGRHLIDLASGGWGYAQDAQVRALRAQLACMGLSSRAFYNRTFAAFVRALVQAAPRGLSVAYPCNSSSEAMEGALKLATAYHPGRHTVVTVAGAFHGHTMSAAAVSVKAFPHRAHMLGSLTVEAVAYGNTDAAIQAIARRPAAFVMEPLETSNGYRYAGHGYLRAIRSACDQHGVILIMNETKTGLGIAGPQWMCAAADVVPDILVTGNVLGGGVTSLAAYLCKRHINQRVYGRRDAALHGGTTAGNPGACAVGVSVLNSLPLDTTAAQDRLKAGLAMLQEKFPELVLEANAIGLLGAFRVADADVAQAIRSAALAEGLAVCSSMSIDRSAWIQLRPPLVAAAHEIDLACARLADVLQVITIKWSHAKTG